MAAELSTRAAPYAPAIGQPRAGDLMRQRIHRVLAIARAFGHVTLVLGAWGCGAFKNDPYRTATNFCQALENAYGGAFSNVVFAITDWSPERIFSGLSVMCLPRLRGKRKIAQRCSGGALLLPVPLLRICRSGGLEPRRVDRANADNVVAIRRAEDVVIRRSKDCPLAELKFALRLTTPYSCAIVTA
jgi:hypothetical protein